MNVKHLLSVGVVALFTIACGYSIKTSTDYDRNVRFSNYQSFFIMKGNSSGNPLMDQRAQADVETALTSKGWMEVPEGQGQAAVVVHAATKTKHTYETFYDGWGGVALARGRLRRRDDVRQRLQGRHAGRRHFRREDQTGDLARLCQRCAVGQREIERSRDRTGH